MPVIRFSIGFARTLTSLLLLTCAMSVFAGTAEKIAWAPIPPEVWAMKSDPVKCAMGAVVLEDRYEINDTKLIRTFRVRILSDSGREAANLFLFMGDSPKIGGQTVYPDGKTVVFDNIKDFNTKPVVETYRFEAKRTAVVAPGINGDCVFEVRWEEAALGQRYTRFIRYLGGKFPVQTTAVDVYKNLRRSVQVIPGKGIRTEVADFPEYKRFTLLNLPGQEEVPYGLTVLRGLPRIVVFNRQVSKALSKQFAQESDPGKRANLFWSEFASEDLKPLFEHGLVAGDAFSALRTGLFKNLPASPHARATALLTRLNARIRNRDQSTYAEIAANKGIKNYSDWLDFVNLSKTFHFENIAETGVTTKYGMRSMYYHLLKEAGLKPWLGLVADRNTLLMDYFTLDSNQVMHVLVGVDEPGKGILWIDPTTRFSTPGLIAPEYQGTTGVLVDSAAWTATPFTVPVQPAQVNTRQFQFVITPDDEGESFSMSAEFTGVPELTTRNRFLAFDASAQSKTLKEDLEGATKSLAITRAEVLNAQDLQQNTSWKVQGRLDLEAIGAKEVVPFPGMPLPLSIPNRFPDDRTESIILPYKSIHLADARIEVPIGLKYEPAAPFSRTNRFGNINWVATPEEKDGKSTIRVVMRIDILGFYEPASAYQDFKAFVGWIKDVSSKCIVLEPTR